MKWCSYEDHTCLMRLEALGSQRPGLPPHLSPGTTTVVGTKQVFNRRFWYSERREGLQKWFDQLWHHLNGCIFTKETSLKIMFI